MKLALPKFQFRFMAALGNVIFPGNFHPVGTQRAAEAMVEEVLADRGKPPSVGAGGNWMVVGGSGGFGSAARVALGVDMGAHTVNVSFDGPPQPDSSNKIRKIGSPGWHRNLAIERRLSGLGLQAASHNIDAFDPESRAVVVEDLLKRFGKGGLNGLVWALAAPRGLDPRTGKPVRSVLKPLGNPAVVKTFGGPTDDHGPQIAQLEIPPGSPEEAIATIYVMGGGIVATWIDALSEAGVLAEGFTLLTISYRGNPLNEAIYRKGLIGLAKADLEFTSSALDARLRDEIGGRAIAVEGPAVVTEASGGIPGVPLYMALVRDVMGADYEEPLASMRRMFRDNFAAGSQATLDEEGLLRMDDRELAAPVQSEMARRFEPLEPGQDLDVGLYDDFMRAYAQTRGFEVDGVDYAAEFDTDEICRID